MTKTDMKDLIALRAINPELFDDVMARIQARKKTKGNPTKVMRVPLWAVEAVVKLIKAGP